MVGWLVGRSVSWLSMVELCEHIGDLMVGRLDGAPSLVGHSVSWMEKMLTKLKNAFSEKKSFKNF